MSRLQVSRAVLVLLVLAGCSPGGEGPPRGGAGGGAGAPAGGSGGAGFGGGSGGSGGAVGGTGGGGGGGAGAGGSGGATSPDAAGGAGGGGAGGRDAGPGPADVQGGAGGGAGPDAALADRPPAAGPTKMVLIAGNLAEPFGVAVDPMTGDLYSADVADDRIKRIAAGGAATTVVGPGAPGAGGRVTMSNPHDILFQPGTRNLYIADTMGSRVLRWDAATGEVTVLAGEGGKVPAGGNTFCLAFDPAGRTLYFTGGGGIRVVDLQTETLKTTLPFANPRVITVDSKGTLYAVRNGGTALQTVDAMGRASDVPGGSPLSAPKRITTDGEDNVIIIDTESHSIRKWVQATRTLVRLAGNGMAGTGRLDGPPEMAQTNRPHGGFVDALGRILIADSSNDRIIAIVR